MPMVPPSASRGGAASATSKAEKARTGRREGQMRAAVSRPGSVLGRAAGLTRHIGGGSLNGVLNVSKLRFYCTTAIVCDCNSSN